MKATIIFKILMITISVCFVSDIAIFWDVKHFASTQNLGCCNTQKLGLFHGDVAI